MFATVYNWANEFKRGRTSTKDEHRSGHPVEVATPEMIDKIIELKFESLQHPPFSPNLAPSDFFLFPNLKKWLGW